MLPNWPVKFQGARGTCVAFSLVACRELRAHEEVERIPEGPPHLSEQYLFWASKLLDGQLHLEGTRIEYGAIAIETRGVCKNLHWPYQLEKLHALQHQITHADDTKPSEAAHSSAREYIHIATTLPPTAKNVREGLANCNAVALALLVLNTEDVAGKKIGNNWSNDITRRTGRVLDPFIQKRYRFTSAKVGHAICVVGHHPDTKAPGGGWFVFRNSWGVQWGEHSVSLPHQSLPAGYGTVSAMYVEKYGLEMAVLPKSSKTQVGNKAQVVNAL